MSFLDALFGRRSSKAVKPQQTEKLFAISTASVTLETRWGLQPGGAGAVVFRPQASSYFAQTAQELDALLTLTSKEQQSEIHRESDGLGFEWIVVRDPDFEDLVAAIHMVTLTLGEHGFRDQLLAAVFRFDGLAGGPMYWIYNYKRGSYYPFIPRGDHERDNIEEIRLGTVMDRELPVEKTPEQWYALWGTPI